MKFFANSVEAIQNLLASKLRSILALLGILVGTASVVAMVSGGELATNEALKQFKTLGTDLLALTVIDNTSDSKISSGTQDNLTLFQATNMVSADKSILELSPYTQLYSPSWFDGHEINATTLGVTESFSKIIHVEISSGRFISSSDGYSFYCVIGNGIASQIKTHTFLNPIGQQIQIGKNYFTIIGIAKPWPENGFIYANIDNAILIPLMTSTVLSKYANIHNIIARLKPNANIEIVKSNLTNYINQILSKKRLYFRSAKELIASMAKQSDILTIFLGLIGGISLFVGGIGVMNIMLVSVIERKREIGIRLALGATSTDIRSLFLIEAIILSLTGGLLGVLVGIAIAYLISVVSHWQFIFFLLPPTIGFTVSVAIGIFFGFYPAHKASQLDPIVALRSE